MNIHYLCTYAIQNLHIIPGIRSLDTNSNNTHVTLPGYNVLR